MSDWQNKLGNVRPYPDATFKLSDFSPQYTSGDCTYPNCPCPHATSMTHYCIAKLYREEISAKQADKVINHEQ
jgi:hypothetical protein